MVLLSKYIGFSAPTHPPTHLLLLLRRRIFNASYVPHGLKVVRAQAEGGGLRGLMELERRWRQHFLSSMRPRHLPPLWAVDHNHRKLRHKYGEDLPVLLL